MKTVAASLCFCLLTLLCFEASGGDKGQDKEKRSYASAAADCDKAISARKSELAESYSSEVWTLKQRFQKDGDLEKALAADKEWSRSIRREPLTPEDLVESPKELRILQDAYVERQDCVEQEVAADVVRELEREAKELAQAGNLTDGRVLQQEIDKIKRLYLSDMTANNKSSSMTKSKKPTGSNNPEDPVAACEEAIRQKRVSLQAQYVGELEAMEKSFQAKGALEDLFAAKAERQRFMQTPLLAEANIVETPDALRELQQKYLELQQSVATSVAEEHTARLEQQKQALTIEGKLEEAVKASGDAQKIRQRYLVAETQGKPGWVVLFRSDNPLDWGKPVGALSGASANYARSENDFPRSVRFLRMTRMDTRQSVIMSIKAEWLTTRNETGRYRWQPLMHQAPGTSAGHCLGIIDSGSIKLTEANIGTVAIGDVPRVAWFSGWGFGEVFYRRQQGYAWSGQTIGRVVFEIAVTGGELSKDEKKLLLK